MKKVVIYSGRFQPMLSHHAKVYDRLQAQFPDAEVYIGTSDKVEGQKSPFSFKEKQMIAQAHGIDPNKVLMAKRPYHKDDYSKYFNEENTHIFFAVGEKDLDRFPFNNVDPDTDLDMTVRGESKPKYYQKINTYKQDPMPMSKRGYITLAPTIQAGDEVASASAFRSAIQNAPDEEKAKAVYTKQFGEFDQAVFDLIYNKIKGSKMSEDINTMRKLAGLSEAPVEFDTPVVASKATFLEPNKSSAKMSIANRFPQGADVNDPEVKKEQFIQALMKSPASLLSEINERLDPKEENNMMIGQKLDDIINELGRDKNVAQLEADDKKFVLDVVKVALTDMQLVAGDDSEPEYQPEPEEDDLDNIVNPMDRNESLDLDDIRSEYGVEKLPEEELEEGGECYHCDGKDADCDHCNGTGYVQFDDDPQEPSEDEIEKHAKKESAINEGSKVGFIQGTDYDWGYASKVFGGFVVNVGASPDNVQKYKNVYGEPDYEQHNYYGDQKITTLAFNFVKPIDLKKFAEEHNDMMSKVQESAPFGEPSEDDQMYQDMMDAYDKGGEEGLAQEIGMSLEELDQEMSEYARDHSLHMDDDRDEVIQGYVEELINNRDRKEYESIEEDEKDQFKGSTKDGHKYRAVADDQGASQYLKVFYGDGKYFRIYYDSNIVGGKAGGYDHTSVAPETNDPKAEEVFADLPDDFFDKYGSEGETGLEDIIDMIKSADESIEEAKNCGCGKNPCETYGKVEETADKAMQAAIQELRSLAGI